MKYRAVPLLFLLILAFSLSDCAKRGTIHGGWKDTLAPVPVKYFPENYSVNFQGNEIFIQFDEYIKLKDIQKQLLISPPLNTMPQITPLGVSKQLRIRFSDTLKANTTYTIHFGNSIVDNNEENPLEGFRYVFSTGNYIDSLQFSGTVADALLINPDENITVMLYEDNEQYNDSMPYLHKPYYLTNTRATPGQFNIENIKPGNYRLIAITDKNDNYLYDPKTEKIGFLNEAITVPSDSTYSLTLFKAAAAYRLVNAFSVNKNRVQFGYEGDTLKNPEVKWLGTQSENFKSRLYFISEKDTLDYWFRPQTEADTLMFAVHHLGKADTVAVRVKHLLADSLKLNAYKTGIFSFDEALQITANNPIEKINESLISVIDKDSLGLSFSATVDKLFNTLQIEFQKKESQNYLVTFFPGAVTDFFGNENDTLYYRVNTRSKSDYGYLSMQIQHSYSHNILVELVKENGEFIMGVSHKEFDALKGEYRYNIQNTYEFNDITPGKYYVRVVLDENNNEKWDTGSFMDKKQPEKVIYFPKQLEIRANWTLNETFVLQ